MTLSRVALPILLVSAFTIARQPVSTAQHDPARAGANIREFILTPRNVRPDRFGKLFKLPVDGAIYAQPLYLPSVEVPGKGVHDIVFVATAHDTVFAFDAAGTPPSPLWQVNLAGAGAIPVPAADLECPLVEPEAGIVATPAIDRATGTLYVLARTRAPTGLLGPRYAQKLHALAVTTGAEKFGGPVTIRASVTGRGDGNANGKVAFDPLRENPRAALLLSGGVIYLAWASSCDVGPYHGWLMAYDARTLKQTAVWNASPDAGGAGIWLGAAGPAADPDGNIFVVTGNGRFDVARGGHDYGDSVVKLRRAPGACPVVDYFTPFNQEALNQADQDLGSGGPLLLPDQPGPHRHLLLAGGKGGTLYLLDRDRLGGFHAGSDQGAVQTIGFGKSALFGAPAFWHGHVFVIPGTSVLRDFALRRGRLVPARNGAPPEFPDGGATPVVSSNGSHAGIVWAVSTYNWQRRGPPAVLRAYDARNVGRELYDSERDSARDRAGEALRFTIPLVAAGRVYVGTRGELDVYGLLPPR